MAGSPRDKDPEDDVEVTDAFGPGERARADQEATDLFWSAAKLAQKDPKLAAAMRKLARDAGVNLSLDELDAGMLAGDDEEDTIGGSLSRLYEQAMRDSIQPKDSLQPVGRDPHEVTSVMAEPLDEPTIPDMSLSDPGRRPQPLSQGLANLLGAPQKARGDGIDLGPVDEFTISMPGLSPEDEARLPDLDRSLPPPPMDPLTLSDPPSLPEPPGRFDPPPPPDEPLSLYEPPSLGPIPALEDVPSIGHDDGATDPEQTLATLLAQLEELAAKTDGNADEMTIGGSLELVESRTGAPRLQTFAEAPPQAERTIGGSMELLDGPSLSEAQPPRRPTPSPRAPRAARPSREARPTRDLLSRESAPPQRPARERPLRDLAAGGLPSSFRSRDAMPRDEQTVGGFVPVRRKDNLQSVAEAPPDDEQTIGSSMELVLDDDDDVSDLEPLPRTPGGVRHEQAVDPTRARPRPRPGAPALQHAFVEPPLDPDEPTNLNAAFRSRTPAGAARRNPLEEETLIQTGPPVDSADVSDQLQPVLDTGPTRRPGPGGPGRTARRAPAPPPIPLEPSARSDRKRDDPYREPLLAWTATFVVIVVFGATAIVLILLMLWLLG